MFELFKKLGASQISRRWVLVLMGFLGLRFFSRKTTATAQENAPIAPSSDQEPVQCDLKKSDDPVFWDHEKIYYWVDGLHVPESTVSSRGTLAILLKHQQTTQSFVDKVVLADKNDNLISARYFSSQDRMISGGFVPYIIFDNLDFANHTLPLSLFIQVREGEALRRFQFAFPRVNLNRSKLNKIYLPPQLRYELQTHDGGFVSTYYHFHKKLPPERFGYHIVKPLVRLIQDNGQFTIQVRFMHEDNSDGHYNRYFIITDPVGRIVGLQKRSFNDGQKGFVTIHALSEQERNLWRLTKDNVARITDCPYVMVFVDDVAESLSKTNIWLR